MDASFPSRASIRGWVAASWCAGVAAASFAACTTTGAPADPVSASPAAAAKADPEPVTVRVIAFNDFHGALLPPDGKVTLGPDRAIEAGGAAYLAAHVDALRSETPHSVVVAAGDLVGATPLTSSMFHDEPAIEALGELGLDLASVGNHEFDEGPLELRRLQEGGCHPVDGCATERPFAGARFRYLAANVRDETGRTLFPPLEIRRFGPVQIAFIGMTLEGTPSVTVPGGVAGLRFDDEVETVQALMPQLEAAGVRAVVVVIHEGGNHDGPFDGCGDLSGPIVAMTERFDDAVDVVVTGHTHQAYVCEVDGKVVTSAGSSGRFVTAIDLVVDPATQDVVEATARNQVVDHERPPDPAVAAIVQTYAALAHDRAQRVVARLQAEASRTANEAGESVLGRIIADAQLAAGRSAGAQVAFMNPGGIRASLVVGDGGGDVTFDQVFAVHPFGNTVITMSVPGSAIHDVLEAQWRDDPTSARVLQISAGSSYRWHPDRPVGDRVDPADIVIEGKPLRLDATYRISINSFLASGGDGFEPFAAGTDRVDHGTDADLLEAYLHAHSPFRPPTEARIRRAPARRGQR